MSSMDETVLAEGVDILALQGIDPALDAKMHIVNNVRNTFQSTNIGCLHRTLSLRTDLSHGRQSMK